MEPFVQRPFHTVKFISEKRGKVAMLAAFLSYLLVAFCNQYISTFQPATLSSGKSLPLTRSLCARGKSGTQVHRKSLKCKLLSSGRQRCRTIKIANIRWPKQKIQTFRLPLFDRDCVSVCVPSEFHTVNLQILQGFFPNRKK